METEIRWTDERVAELRRMRADGKSMGACAVALGHGITRNAVIGKCHRLGIEGLTGRRPKPASPPKPAKAAEPRAPKATGQRMKPALVAIDQRLRGLPLFCRETRFATTGPTPLKLALDDLRDRQCRYPASLHPATQVIESYCGWRTRGGSWCPHHAKLVYYTPKTKSAA